MEYFLEQCKNRRILIGNFYIATNAVKITESFVMFTLRLFAYCDEKEYCQVHVSNDIYHMDLTDFDLELLEGLKFFGKKFAKDRDNYSNGVSLINEGRSQNNRHAHKVYSIDDEMTAEEFTDECEVYLNCKGEIINGCNWSYSSQKKHKLCDVGEMSKYYEELQEAQLHF